MTDPIADMLTQIRNALMVGKTDVVLPHSKFKQQLAELMVKQGLIEEIGNSTRGQHKQLDLKLKYVNGKPAIMGIKRVSSPGQRIYSKSGEIPRTLSGYGLTIVSTSKGLMADRQARKERLGGEVICQIW
jgi:small subunit ribosomal protein S8